MLWAAAGSPAQSSHSRKLNLNVRRREGEAAGVCVLSCPLLALLPPWLESTGQNTGSGAVTRRERGCQYIFLCSSPFFGQAVWDSSRVVLAGIDALSVPFPLAEEGEDQ